MVDVCHYTFVKTQRMYNPCVDYGLWVTMCQGSFIDSNNGVGTSLVAQWLRIHLPMQGTQVQALAQEDPTCRGATKPVHHNY